MVKQIYFDMDDSSLKRRLKDFLLTTPEFSGVNFSASNASKLLEVLVPAIKHLSFFQNMSMNEIFLETATLRKNLVAVAKQMGYTPKRYISAEGFGKATDSDATGGNNLIIPNGTVLTVNGIAYYTTSAINFTSASAWSGATAYVVGDQVEEAGNFYECIYAHTNKIPTSGANRVYWKQISDGLSVLIPVRQGTVTSTIYTTSNSNVYEFGGNIYKIKLPYYYPIASNAEFTVEGKLSTDVAFSTYINALESDDAITATSKVYWLKEINGELWVYLGDGTTGYNLPYATGNQVKITYTVSLGYDGNIQAGDAVSPASSGTFNFTAHENIDTGRNQEIMAEIRANAPLFYNSANRGVTDDDYIACLVAGAIYNVNAWGGEYEFASVSGMEWYGIPFDGVQIAHAYTVGETINVGNKAIYRCLVNDTLTKLSDLWDAHSTSWEKIGQVDLGRIYISGLDHGILDEHWYLASEYANMWNNIIGSKRGSGFEPIYIDPSECELNTTINIYYKNLNFVNSTYDQKVQSFVVGELDDNYTGFNKTFYPGQLATSIINEFKTINTVTVDFILRLKIRLRPEYNPLHSVTDVYKRVFHEIASVTIPSSVTEYYLSGNYIKETSTANNIGEIHLADGIIEIYDFASFANKTEDLLLDLVLTNKNAVVGERELYLKRGTITINSSVTL